MGIVVSRWELEPDRFAAEWFNDQGNEMFPVPLSYTSRYTHQNEWDAFRQQVAAEHVGDEFEELRGALELVASPRARVEAIGFTGAEHAVTVRVLGCVGTRHGVLAAQRPTEHGEGGGNIVIWTLPVEQLPERMAAVLPDPPPGSRPGGYYSRETLAEPVFNGIVQFGEPERTRRDDYLDIVEAPRDHSISIRSYPGDRTAGAPQVAGFQLIDVTDDGRYLRTGSDPIKLHPITRADLTARLTTILDTAVKYSN